MTVRNVAVAGILAVLAACGGDEAGTPGVAGPCASDADCAGGACRTEALSGFPGGMCRLPCVADADCGADGWCSGSGDADLEGVCLARCDDGCRDGWVCAPADGAGARACLPDCRRAGCPSTGQCDPSSGVCGNVPAGGVPGGGACFPSDDKCGFGLACVPGVDGAPSTCRPTCYDTPDCAARSACVPLADGTVGATPEIGYCLAGDDCDPYAPAAACGAGMGCDAVPPATLCVTPGAGERGADCVPGGCKAGLTCLDGRCLGACAANGTGCQGAEACTDLAPRLGDLPFHVCLPGCSVFDQSGCGAGDLCVPLLIVEGEVRALCAARTPGAAKAGDSCTPGDDYWGSCGADLACIDLGIGAACRALCDASDAGACATGTCARRAFLAPFQDLGVCVAACTPAGDGDSGCTGEDSAVACVVTGLVTGGDESLAPVGECAPSRGLGEGGACKVGFPDGAVDCADGLVCVPATGGGRCARYCRTGDADPCPAGGACTAGFLEGLSDFGVCSR